MLSLLYRFFPDAKCILWPKNINEAVEKMLLRHFPSLEILYFDQTSSNKVENDEFNRIVESCDMLIHSSGPGVVGIDQVIYWKQRTDKPYGMIGITIDGIGSKLQEVLEEAAFIYTRETASLRNIEREDLPEVITGFAPDSTFALSLSDEITAKRFLDNHQLKEKEFICIISRLRYTPYHEIYPDIGWTREKIREVEETNDRFKEEDHVKMRDLISWWIEETGNKVLVCPEMTYQVNIMDSLIIDLLPNEYKKKVIKHDYWLPDEAASIYKRAHTVISMECHSPIIAAANGTPCFYLRQPQNTIKGQMWYDLGLARWVFEIEDITCKELIRELNKVNMNYQKSKQFLARNLKKVDKLYKSAFREVRTILK